MLIGCAQESEKPKDINLKLKESCISRDPDGMFPTDSKVLANHPSYRRDGPQGKLDGAFSFSLQVLGSVREARSS